MKNTILITKKGGGYVLATQPSCFKQLEPMRIEMIVSDKMGEKYSLLTTNNSKDELYTNKDHQRLYTLLKHHAYKRMKEREQAAKNRKNV